MGYFEIPEEDRPPERIWLDDEALKSHFETVEQRRNAGTKGEVIPEADMTRNELTADLRK